MDPINRSRNGALGLSPLFVASAGLSTWLVVSGARTARRPSGAGIGHKHLSHRYRSEFEVLEVPLPVRRLVVPVIAAAGRLLGLHRRFAGVPEPVRRSPPAAGA